MGVFVALANEEFISDVKNSLTVIIGLTQVIGEISREEKVKEHCNEILKHAKDIVEDVNIFFNV